MKIHQFKPTLKIITYLYALCVGPYIEFRVDSDIPLGFYCRKTMEKYLRPEIYSEWTIKGLEFSKSQNFNLRACHTKKKLSPILITCISIMPCQYYTKTTMLQLILNYTATIPNSCASTIQTGLYYATTIPKLCLNYADTDPTGLTLVMGNI